MTSRILYIFLILLTFSAKSQVAITIPSEYEKNDKLLMVWPYSSGIDSIIAEITSVVMENIEVNIVINPENADTAQIRGFLSSQNANNENVKFILGATDTYLLRQYGPVNGYGVFSDSLVSYIGNPSFTNHNRPMDNNFPKLLANTWEMDSTDYGLQFEVSNIQYDGLRYLFVGDRILEDNLPLDEVDVSFALNSYYNSGIIHYIPSFNQSGGGPISSIDNYIKLLDFETIAITSVPDTLPDYNEIENMVSEIGSLSNYYGSEFKIIRMPAPPNNNGKYPITANEELRSYTNSLVINNIIIVPSFGLPEFDSAAYQLYKDNMPGYIVKLVDSRLLTKDYAGIHTITKEIPQSSYLRIKHQKVLAQQNYVPNFKITCLVGSGNRVDDVWLYYKINDDTSYTKTEIHQVCPQHFAIIDKLLPSDTIHYYIELISSTTQTTYPLSAPDGNFTFWFDVVSGEDETLETKKYEIAPNPSNGSFIILGDNSVVKNVIIDIYNLAGQLITKQQVATNQTINLSDLLKIGHYTIVIDDGVISNTQKLVIIN